MFTNILGRDRDIGYGFFRVSSLQAWRPLHVLQPAVAVWLSLAHLKKGSVTVKPGDEAKAGRRIADMGISGDSEFVHLHYQLMRGTGLDIETLPAYFDKLEVRRGGRSLPSRDVALDSGDLVQTVR